MINGGLGWFWGLLGELLEAFGPQDGPKLEKVTSWTPPRGTLLGAFSAPVPLWGALGTLKWWSLGGIHVDITFLIKF